MQDCSTMGGMDAPEADGNQNLITEADSISCKALPKRNERDREGFHPNLKTMLCI